MFFSAVSHNIRIAGARGHVRSFVLSTLFGDHIFPYGDLVGACLKKLISDPATLYIPKETLRLLSNF